MDIRAYNRSAWDRQVADGNEWTIPVGSDAVASAREGTWEVYLTPSKPVPHAWFPPMAESHVLCLASGGGQQGPILAAVGANVTVYDNSPAQLAQDRMVATRDGLALRSVEGDMRDLSAFADETFDLVFHPVSNVFVPDVRPVWREAYRVLRRRGVLLAGFGNPVTYIFDINLAEQGTLEVRNTLPYSDLESRSPESLKQYLDQGWPLEFSHSLEEQIGGQIDAGFVLTGLFEDNYPPEQYVALSKYMPMFIATRAVKP